MSEKVEKFLMANGIVPGENAAKQYGVKGMKWGKTKAKDELLVGGGGAGYDPLEDVKTLINLKPSLREIKEANGGAFNKKSNDVGHRLYPLVQIVNQILGDKRSPPVRNLDFYTKTNRFLKGLFGVKK